MAQEKNDTAPSVDPLEPFRGEEFRLLISDRTMLQQVDVMFSKLLGFTAVKTLPPGTSRNDSIEKLAKVLLTTEVHALVDPTGLLKAGENKSKNEAWRDFLVSVKARIGQTKSDEEKVFSCLSRIVPVLVEASNYQIREKYVRTFAHFRIPGAFIFPHAESNKLNEQIKERLPILREFLEELLTGKDTALEKIKNRERDEKLSERKAKADKLMAEGVKLKNSGNFEEAIIRFNKAIELFPENPDAFMESGRGYNKIRKYTKAIQRFTEAEEVARDLPAPNQEIAGARVLQIKEMIDNGSDPESPEVSKLVGEVISNFNAALKKAESVTPVSEDDSPDGKEEAVARIAGSIFKTGLGEQLGHRHKAVQELGVLARGYLEKTLKTDSDNMPGSQMICLGLAASDEGDYQEAERLLFQAAERKECFMDACREINYVGAQLRKKSGPNESLRLYTKLLDLNPPNKAAVLYNMAVATMAKNKRIDAAGYIVQSVYTDPSLPKERMFYENQEIRELLPGLITSFEKIGENSDTMAPVKPQEPTPLTPSDATFPALKNRLEQMIRQDKNSAIKTMFVLGQKAPRFLISEEALGSELIMAMSAHAHKSYKSSNNPQIVRFVKLLAHGQDEKKRREQPVIPFAEELVNLETAISKGSANSLGMFLAYLNEKPDFFRSGAALKSESVALLASKIMKKQSAGGNIKGLKSIAPVGDYLAERTRYVTFVKCIESAVNALAQADQRLTARYIAQAITVAPESVDRHYFYEERDIVAISKEILMKLGAVNKAELN